MYQSPFWPSTVGGRPLPARSVAPRVPVGPATVDCGPVGPVTVLAAPVTPVGPVGPGCVETEPVGPVGPAGPLSS